MVKLELKYLKNERKSHKRREYPGIIQLQECTFRTLIFQQGNVLIAPMQNRIDHYYVFMFGIHTIRCTVNLINGLISVSIQKVLVPSFHYIVYFWFSYILVKCDTYLLVFKNIVCTN